MKFRIGHGIDVHAFEAGDHIVLGGVKVPHNKGVKAHSDGDVILHATTDALLGALGMGDIGQWFPDTDPEFEDIESKNMIVPIIMSMADHGFKLNNLDVTVVAQAPKVSIHTDQIRENMARLFNADISQINIKATTTEHLGAMGRKEGISAHVVISLIGQSTPDEKLSSLIDDKSEDNVLKSENPAGAENLIDLSAEVEREHYDFNDN